MTWRLHIEKTAAKALDMYIRNYSLFRSERLSINIKLTLYKTIIKSVMFHARPIWKNAADALRF
jgi:hypothetical protein